MKRTLLALIVVALSGCSSIQNVNYDFTNPATVEYKAPVVLSPLEVSVQPTTAPQGEISVILTPIRIVQSIENPNAITKSLTWQIWQTWMQEKAFSSMDYVDTPEVQTLEGALQYARSKNVSLLVTGISNFFLDGGSVGTSRIGINLQIYDVATGVLLWSMHQNGEIQRSETRDFMILSTKSVLPNNAIGTIVASIAYNMVQPIKLWRTSRPHYNS